MTYVAAAGSPKAVRAKQWGDEMMRACRARNVTLNELGRTVGHGHTALDHYRVGAVLPRTATAYAVADALAWPRLREMIDSMRSFPCDHCGRRFRHDGGGPRRYCTITCRKAAESLRLAERRRRQAGQTRSPRSANAATQRMKGVIRSLQGEIAVLRDYVDAMCRSCEPEGTCRLRDCALRPVSPLPFHEPVDEPRSARTVRVQAWSPERRERQSRSSHERWARPGEREAQAARNRVYHASVGHRLTDPT